MSLSIVAVVVAGALFIFYFILEQRCAFAPVFFFRQPDALSQEENVGWFPRCADF